MKNLLSWEGIKHQRQTNPIIFEIPLLLRLLRSHSAGRSERFCVNDSPDVFAFGIRSKRARNQAGLLLLLRVPTADGAEEPNPLDWLRRQDPAARGRSPTIRELPSGAPDPPA